MHISRRALVRYSALSSLALLTGCASNSPKKRSRAKLFDISLAQWSLHRTLFGEGHSQRVHGLSLATIKQRLQETPAYFLRGNLDPLDFPIYARDTFGIHAVEYVNTFYLGKARDEKYLTELNLRSRGEGIDNVLIMCDLEGNLGAKNKKERQRSVENHHQWVDAAAFLGCHAIRVNAKSEGTWDEQSKLTADGLHQLAKYSEKAGISILVENHGGLSSHPDWLVKTIVAANHPLVGTLPDFGNFKISETESYDYYEGMDKLLPFAKAMSAKSIDFDESGKHTTFDYGRIIRSIVDSGYKGYLGIEYEGHTLNEHQGIQATHSLLKEIRRELENKEKQKTL